MLTISSKALDVIRRVTGHPRLEEASGVRIAGGSDDDSTLEVAAVNKPEPDDKLVEQDGGRLYVEPEAVERLEGAELDARTDDDDRVEFVLRHDEDDAGVSG